MFNSIINLFIPGRPWWFTFSVDTTTQLICTNFITTKYTGFFFISLGKNMAGEVSRRPSSLLSHLHEVIQKHPKEEMEGSERFPQKRFLHLLLAGYPCFNKAGVSIKYREWGFASGCPRYINMTAYAVSTVCYAPQVYLTIFDLINFWNSIPYTFSEMYVL